MEHLEKQILPCPFCGHNVEYQQSSLGDNIQCSFCPARMSQVPFSIEDDRYRGETLVALWNTRDGEDSSSLQQIITQKKKQNADLYYQNSEMLRVLKYAASQATSPNFNTGNWIDMVIGITTRVEQGTI